MLIDTSERYYLCRNGSLYKTFLLFFMCHSVTFVGLTTVYKREVFYINFCFFVIIRRWVTQSFKKLSGGVAVYFNELSKIIYNHSQITIDYSRLFTAISFADSIIFHRKVLVTHTLSISIISFHIAMKQAKSVTVITAINIYLIVQRIECEEVFHKLLSS